MRVLLIEDDLVLGAAIRDQIAADGHSVDWVNRLDRAGHALAAAELDLMLLDLMLPDGLGLPFLRALRTADQDAGDHPDSARPGVGPHRRA